MRTRKRAPSKFCFALKSQERNRHFENENDFVFFLCADNLDKMKDWILNIRHEKVGASICKFMCFQGRKIIMNRDSTRKLDIHDVESLSVKEIIRVIHNPHSSILTDVESEKQEIKAVTDSHTFRSSTSLHCRDGHRAQQPSCQICHLSHHQLLKSEQIGTCWKSFVNWADWEERGDDSLLQFRSSNARTQSCAFHKKRIARNTGRRRFET